MPPPRRPVAARRPPRLRAAPRPPRAAALLLPDPGPRALRDGERPPHIPPNRERARALILPDPGEFPAISPGEIPFIPWPEFQVDYPLREPPPMRSAEMITLLGLKGSGKTTLAVRGILPMFSHVCVLATKQQDDELYPQLRARGFHFTTNPRLNFKEHPRIVFKPAIVGLSRESLAPQKAAFSAVLDVLYALGNVCVYCDEIRFLTDNLGLKTEIETLWLQGRSNRITMVAATQEPVSVPRVVFNQIDHLFIWKYSQKERTKVAAEMTGNSYETTRGAIPELAKHEAIYCRLEDDLVVKTRYQISR